MAKFTAMPSAPAELVFSPPLPRTTSPSGYVSVSSSSLPLSSTSSSDGEGAAVGKNGRKVKSCSECKVKIKCEAGQPCCRCIRSNRACCYEAGPPRTRGKGKKTLLFRDVHSKFAEMMASLQAEKQASKSSSQDFAEGEGSASPGNLARRSPQLRHRLCSRIASVTTAPSHPALDN